MSLHKKGLLFTIIIQSIWILTMITIMGSLFYSPNARDIYSFVNDVSGNGNAGGHLLTVVYSFTALNIIGLIFSLVGLTITNIPKVNSKFTNGILFTAGIFGIFTNLIGGIMILIGYYSNIYFEQRETQGYHGSHRGHYGDNQRYRDDRVRRDDRDYYRHGGRGHSKHSDREEEHVELGDWERTKSKGKKSSK